jgi:hypothetical protein
MVGSALDIIRFCPRPSPTALDRLVKTGKAAARMKAIPIRMSGRISGIVTAPKITEKPQVVNRKQVAPKFQALYINLIFNEE